MTNEELEFKFTQVLYKPLFSVEESAKILEMTNKLDYQEAQAGNTIYDGPFSFNKAFDINRNKSRITQNAGFKVNDHSKWVSDKISQTVIEANNHFFQYEELYFPGFEVLNYGPGGKFDWHMDTGDTHPFNKRKISVILFLSDRNDYEGGQLEFLPDLKEPVKMEQGHIIMFASHKLHRVTPITSGIRKTLVAWGYSK